MQTPMYKVAQKKRFKAKSTLNLLYKTILFFQNLSAAAISRKSQRN